ncbi:retinoic acid receptor responder protein 3-like [Limulus polyphemus]|uniref:Retinoic acid receptor responder protein 3-like n=1 Tax=Limulus polyphemus TaxID=6850 RepID=A0ABM1BX62_LIMPO|nr:retinoic acid receptor responder protein 3-like [Limulus polyphemus]XP_022258287.1 retinoic acid receptor responder protein 3-like [Limulus polyphemus]XP_022258288.1 retinoic acid receptor responder protein 3-like [Limulus polyphemus]
MKIGNEEYTSRWYREYEYERLLYELQTGDLIEFERGFYKHWAVYAGNKKVYHRAYPEDGNSFCMFIQSHSALKDVYRYGEIVLEDLQSVWADSEARINNSMDSKHKPSDWKTVLERAENKMNESQPRKDTYNVIFNNCEHFASYCRYGIGFSKQVDDIKQNVLIVGVTVLTGLVLGKALSVITDHTDRRSQ